MSRRLDARRWATALQRRKQLQNHDFSILCNRCIGGVITHAVGEQFRSPTVNLIIDDNAFLFFCEHVREYADCPIELPTEEELRILPKASFPIGVLRGKEDLPDIPIFFMHFKSFEQAKEKWELRYKRINYDNICIMMDCKMHATKKLLDEFEKLPFERKVVFSHYEDPERWPSNFHYSFYTKEKHGDGVLYRKIKRGLLEYQWMDEFDFITWLNNGTIQKSDLIVES